MQFAYYALGGGHGHAVRGLAVCRQARFAGAEPLLIAPDRFRAWADAEGIPLVAPPPETHRQPGALHDWLDETLAAVAPDVLCVDVFARGILGELRPHTLGGTQCWLIARHVKPAFYAHDSVRTAIEAGYAGLLWCERVPTGMPELHVPQWHVPPVLIRDARECLGREAARRALGVPEGARLVLGLGAGDAAWQAGLATLLEKVCVRLAGEHPNGLALRVLSADLPAGARISSRFPAMALLRAADVVVSGAGYHAVHETEALGIPGVFLPQPRMYDDQFHRVRHRRSAAAPEELEALLRPLLAHPVRQRPRASDGARAVIEHVLRGEKRLAHATA